MDLNHKMTIIEQGITYEIVLHSYYPETRDTYHEPGSAAEADYSIVKIDAEGEHFSMDDLLAGDVELEALIIAEYEKEIYDRQCAYEEDKAFDRSFD